MKKNPMLDYDFGSMFESKCGKQQRFGDLRSRTNPLMINPNQHPWVTGKGNGIYRNSVVPR